MKMSFHNSGRQFFFVTMGVENRDKALSRLVDEKSRPALLPFGEAVKAGLVAMHRVFPCATISDFVIMPDHVHFLLIVDYAKDPAFSPLWAAHRLMDATEMAWRMGRDGGRAPEPLPVPEALLAEAVEQARRNRGRLTISDAPPVEVPPWPSAAQPPQGFGGGESPEMGHLPPQGFGGGESPEMGH